MMVMATRREPTDTPLGRAPRVAWGQWNDGGEWILRRGEDFHQSPYLARRAFIAWGSRNGYNTHARSDEDAGVLIIQAIKK